MSEVGQYFGAGFQSRIWRAVLLTPSTLRHSIMPVGTIDQVVVHMYKMGTGDCFVLKFLKANQVGLQNAHRLRVFGRVTWARSNPLSNRLKRTWRITSTCWWSPTSTWTTCLDLLQGKALLTDGEFQADRVWMGWPENDADAKVSDWKEHHGEKRRALALAAKQLSSRPSVRANSATNFASSMHDQEMLASAKAVFRRAHGLR